jgi:hypothetical protein
MDGPPRAAVAPLGGTTPGTSIAHEPAMTPRTVLVTGPSTGSGRATALLLDVTEAQTIAAAVPRRALHRMELRFFGLPVTHAALPTSA